MDLLVLHVNYHLRPGVSGNIFPALALAWLIYIILRSVYPRQFFLHLQRPNIFYREFQGRGINLFNDYRLLSVLSMVLVFSSLFSFMDQTLNPHNYRGFYYWLSVITVYFLYLIIIYKIWGLKGKAYIYLSFLRFVYIQRFNFLLSFLLFVLIMIELPPALKWLMVGILFAYGWFTYLYREWRIAVNELSVRPLMNILYLCTLEIIPAGILLLLLINRI